MRKVTRIFREELAKAVRVFATAYQTLRELDARTMEILVALLGRAK
jgi:hypothetical protein